jgi:MFS transporter, DHA1 family, multidrug resistance protein
VPAGLPHGRGPFRGLPREVPILTAVSFTVALGYGIVAPAIPTFARQFGVSTAAAASVISAFALMRVVGALPAGRLMDRFGGKMMMAVGIAVVAMSSVLAGFSRSFAELIILRGGGGLGSAMYTVSAHALLLGQVPGRQRGRASGVFSAGFLVGAISGPAVGGLIAAWSLRAPFIIYGCLLIVPAVITVVAVRDTRPGPLASDVPAATPLARAARVWRGRAYLAAASGTFADGFAAMGVRAAIVPLFVRDALHRSALCTGIGFLLFAALNAVALLPGGRAADRLGRRPVIMAGCVTAAAGMAMLALLPSLGGCLAGLAMAGFGSGLLDVAPAAMIGDLLRGRGGMLVASYQMAGDAGAVTGPVAAGFLVDTASYAAAFGLASAVLLLTAILGLFAPETHPRPVPPAQHAQ